MLRIVSPIDGRVAFEVDELDTAEAVAVIGRARDAQRSWREVPLDQRVAVVRRMAEVYAAGAADSAAAITAMMGKPLGQARAEIVGTLAQRTAAMCDLAAGALADEVIQDDASFYRAIRHAPVGVVLDIAAWNYPVAVVVNVVVPAVLAGNAVLIKHAPQTAPVAAQFAAAFAAAGAPDGLVAALPVSHEVVGALFDRRLIDQVSFTGSVRGGHEVVRAVARHNAIGVGLELGGKDPALVLPDADLAYTVPNLVDGALYNAGQSCCAVERIYVHDSLYDRFVDAFAAEVAGYRVGDPRLDGTQLGPVVSADAARRIRAQVDEALAAGGRRVVDPAGFAVPDLTDAYLAPEVLVDVPDDASLLREETFGPAIALCRYHTLDEAIARANASPYGLTASLWTDDLALAHRVAPRIEAGTVFVNRCDYLDPALPWTGVKDSGHGLTLSHHGLRAFTQPQSLHFRTRTT